MDYRAILPNQLEFPSELSAASGILKPLTSAILCACSSSRGHFHEPTSTEVIPDQELASLVGNLGELIRQARQKVLRTVDTVQVQTCWQIGRHIVEFEQEGARRAAYGKQLLATLADKLTGEFGKGFDETNLRKMRLFYQAFPIRDALRLELSWTHYRRLLRVDSEKARNGFMDEAANQNWSSRTLERQIGTLYYQRLLMSRDKAAVIQGNEQLFASKYKLVLPTEDELRAELDRERAALEEQLLDQSPP